jgi:riboflavin synthase
VFSGIVEATAEVLFVEKRENLVEVRVSRPSHFDDIGIGDSIACNGICLTVEKFDDRTIQFALANETLSLLKIQADLLKGQKWNLERSLRFGDRVHGHLVTGHVEALGQVVRSEALGESWLLDIKVPQSLARTIWKKGSIAVHGVSLTVNDFDKSNVNLCLIPETIKRTNLGDLKPGKFVHIETDYLAKAYFEGRSYEL